MKKISALLKELTSRKAEVAKWLINGLSNREIGEKMFISPRTVKAHLTSIFKKQAAGTGWSWPPG